MAYRSPEPLDEKEDFKGGRLDGKVMVVSVFFDRKVANEDNPVLEKLQLNKAADVNRNTREELRGLGP